LVFGDFFVFFRARFQRMGCIVFVQANRYHMDSRRIDRSLKTYSRESEKNMDLSRETASALIPEIPRAKVAVVKCPDYDTLRVREAVALGINLVGGCASIAAPGEKILLKPNLLAADPPEKCVTTHPAVFQAVASAFQATGTRLSYGDSPALGSTERAARRAGIMAAAQEMGLPLADFRNGAEVTFSAGAQNKKFFVAQGVLEADGIISIAKLKTHGLTKLTGAIKNQFGCIPGVLKGEFHVKLPQVDDFARMLVDLNLMLRPRLYVMDGIMTMEGNGPRGGSPRLMGVLLFSTDPVALDATVCRLVNLDPEEIPTLKHGQAMGLGTYIAENIDIVGEGLDELVQPGFKISSSSKAMNLPSPWLRNQIAARPVINADKCIKCGICVEMCPVKPAVVNWPDEERNNVPIYDYSRCIRCYCCQEMCPEGAISLYTPWLGRLFALPHP